MNRSHQTRASDTPARRGQHSRGARLDLQAQAGNRAVAGLLQPRSVQRFGEEEHADLSPPASVHPPPPQPAAPAPVPMPYPTFGDIAGESMDDKHKGEIELLEYGQPSMDYRDVPW